MKKLLAVTMILLFISVSVIPSTGTTDVKQIVMPTTSGNTLYVGGNGTGNYSSIQDAIDDSSSGDTVYVYDDSSPYYENVVVDKSINLVGENRDSTIIDGGGESAIVLSADGVDVSGFNLHNYKFQQYGNVTHVMIIQSDNNIIYDNLVTGNTTFGIYISETAYNNITNNIVNGEFTSGVDIENSNNTTIYKNIISDAKIGNGITVFYSKNNEIIGNRITHCSNGIMFALTIDSYINGNIITNNKYCGIFVDGFASNSVIIRNNISFNGWVGIFYFGNSLNDKIIQNNFIGNEKKNAYFIHPLSWIITVVLFDGIEPFLPKIYWNGNYWDETRLQSYIIPGLICPTGRILFRFGELIERFPTNWINLDRNPATEPYDIEV